MAETFKIGDHVIWNSEAGHIRGTVTAVHTRDVEFMGRTHHASDEAPQYEVKGDKTGHLAMHKGTALNTIAD